MRWVNAVHELTLQPDYKIFDWLTKSYVLSQALRQVCTALTVNVLFQHQCHAFNDESRKLNLVDDQDLPLIREVLLEGDGIPLTYGRVIVPPMTYQAYSKDFESLGDQPIGEKLLYNNPNVRRSAFEYAAIKIGSIPALSNIKEVIWGRRSVFTLIDLPLLVTEIFLPTLPEYPA